MTTLREAAQHALEALELGHAAADAEAQQYHAAMAGYRTERHAQMDAEVQQIAQAITALRAALAQPEHNPTCALLQIPSRECDCRDEAVPEPAREFKPTPLTQNQMNAPLLRGEPEPVAWECKAGGLRPLTQKHYDAQPDNIKRHYTRIAPPRCPNCASLEEQNAELDRKLAELERVATVQEPAAWMQPKTVDGGLRPDLGYETCSKDDYGAFPVYTAPPQRKPLSLTDLQEALVLTNLIDRDAIDNPEEYDEGSTLAQIDELHSIITELLNPR